MTELHPPRYYSRPVVARLRLLLGCAMVTRAANSFAVFFWAVAVFCWGPAVTDFFVARSGGRLDWIDVWGFDLLHKILAEVRG